jgi:hypothetical protein
LHPRILLELAHGNIFSAAVCLPPLRAGTSPLWPGRIQSCLVAGSTGVRAIGRPGRPIDRAVWWLVVGCLHTIIFLLLVRNPPPPPAAGIAEPAMIWLSISESRAAPSRPIPEKTSRAPSGRLHRQQLQEAAAKPPAATATPSSPEGVAVKPSAPPSVDWEQAATRATRDTLAQGKVDERQAASLGSTPQSPYHAPPARATFPWSHQPLSKHVDIDPEALTMTLSTKRCVVAFFLLFVPAAFGCVPGRLDPEPGRGDLFDPKYASQPIEVPKSPLDAASPHR